MSITYLGMGDVARLFNVPYYTIKYAYQVGILPTPAKVAGRKMFTPIDVALLREYFAHKGKRGKKHTLDTNNLQLQKQTV